MPLDGDPIRFADPVKAIARAVEALRPPTVRSVSQWATDRRTLSNTGGGYSGPWSHDEAPHLAAPMDALGSGQFAEVVVQGPSQCGKTEIGLNWIGSLIEDAPANTLIVQPDKVLARTFSVTRVMDMIETTPALARRLRGRDSDNTIHEKTFRNMVLRIVWPVASQLRQFPAGKGWVDDLDEIDDDLDGQGDVVTLLEGRQTTFEGRQTTYVSSSPAKGEKKGISGRRANGTDKRRHWPCPDCGAYGEASYENLAFDHTGSPTQAGESATYTCPVNGCVIAPEAKARMKAAAVWLAPGQAIAPDGIVTGNVARNTCDSYLFDGVFGFATWPALARAWRAAEIEFERLQDEAALRGFYNTKLGRNYVSRLIDSDPLTAEDLAARHRSGFRFGTPPAGVQCLVASVDVHADRFEVQVTGFGHGFETWIVDRFSIRQLGDGRTDIKPGGRPEHWNELLARVLWLRYEREDGAELVIMNTAIDTGGIDDTSENATAFWRHATGAGVHRSMITLVKGGSYPRAALLPPVTYLDRKPGGGPNKHGPALYVPNVHRFKNILDARLRRDEPGPGYVHLADDMPSAYLAELVGEERDIDGLWQRLGPNETLDLTIYALVAFMRHAGTRTDLDWLPAWARAQPDTTGLKGGRHVKATRRPPAADDDVGGERRSPVDYRDPVSAATPAETPVGAAPNETAPVTSQQRRRGLRGRVRS